MKHKFQESQEIAKKNRDKDLINNVKTLHPYLIKRGFLAINKKPRKIYYNCRCCGEPLENRMLQVIGYCMVCERG